MNTNYNYKQINNVAENQEDFSRTYIYSWEFYLVNNKILIPKTTFNIHFLSLVPYSIFILIMCIYLIVIIII